MCKKLTTRCLEKSRTFFGSKINHQNNAENDKLDYLANVWVIIKRLKALIAKSMQYSQVSRLKGKAPIFPSAPD